MQMAPHWHYREHGELQDDYGNGQRHAGAGNSFAVRERACKTASGKICHEVDWSEAKESWPWPQHHIAAEWAVVLSYIPWGDAMVRLFQGREYIWLENSELLLCPTPVFCEDNISAKILDGSLFFGARAHQRPGIRKSFAIFSAECVSHPQEHQALAALGHPHSCPPQFSKQCGVVEGRWAQGVSRCSPQASVHVPWLSEPWTSPNPHQRWCHSTGPRWKAASGLQCVICSKLGSFPIELEYFLGLFSGRHCQIYRRMFSSQLTEGYPDCS